MLLVRASNYKFKCRCVEKLFAKCQMIYMNWRRLEENRIQWSGLKYYWRCFSYVITNTKITHKMQNKVLQFVNITYSIDDFNIFVNAECNMHSKLAVHDFFSSLLYWNARIFPDVIILKSQTFICDGKLKASLLQ